MNEKVPFRTTESLEQDSASLLKEYEDARGLVLKPPIPIEDIIEKHLKLTIEFDDTHDIYKVPIPPNGERTILGSIDHEGHIIIDVSLDPDDNPDQRGRYRFTLAHEGGGHWQLHQILLNEKVMQRSLFDNPSRPTARAIICRSTKKKPPHEWQADFYAACLLMPREMIQAAWQERFPERETPQGNSLSSPKIERRSVVEDRDHFEEREEMALNRLCKPLADRFEVSFEAMRIRLQALGLLPCVTLQQQSFRF